MAEVESPQVKKEEEPDTLLPEPLYLGIDRDPHVNNAKRRRFAGNEDGALLDYGIRLHSLVARLQESAALRFTKNEAEGFTFLAGEIAKRASQLVEFKGRVALDNFYEEFQVVGRYTWSDQSPIIIERHKYTQTGTIRVYFSLSRNNYFYYNPDGDFYGHYIPIGGRCKAIKLSGKQIRTYDHPPNKYMSQTRAQAGWSWAC